MWQIIIERSLHALDGFLSECTWPGRENEAIKLAQPQHNLPNSRRLDAFLTVAEAAGSEVKRFNVRDLKIRRYLGCGHCDKLRVEGLKGNKMVNIRKIKKVWKSKPTVEGAGVHLKRAFGFHEVPEFDPFLLLDDFHSANPALYLPGFPWHPHRGIETITYVLKGDVEHGDSLGNQGTISAGDVQWMTAGSGVIHQEMPNGDESGLLWGFQLWANLPSSHKMMPPRYRDVKRAQIPEVALENGARVKIICGELNGVQGPVGDIIINPEYLDVSLPAGRTFNHPLRRNHTVFAYVIEGAGFFDRERDAFAHEVIGRNYFDFNRQCLCDTETLITFGEGDAVAITTEEQPLRFLLVSGKPIGEPVAWYGPIVMNTQEQLRRAFEEYRNGTFIRHS